MTRGKHASGIRYSRATARLRGYEEAQVAASYPFQEQQLAKPKRNTTQAAKRSPVAQWARRSRGGPLVGEREIRRVDRLRFRDPKSSCLLPWFRCLGGQSPAVSGRWCLVLANGGNNQQIRLGLVSGWVSADAPNCDVIMKLK